MEKDVSNLTTHAEWGAGNPRLIVRGPGVRREVPIAGELIRIGSGPQSNIRVDGLDREAGEIRHDDRDEFVFIPHAPGETNARLQPMDSVGGQDGEVLRTGARFTLGDWEFVFQRDEPADHGRPFGGREGGENDLQRPQPARPDYTDHDAASPADG